jgi:CheY-like chemotaxis protein
VRLFLPRADESQVEAAPAEDEAETTASGEVVLVVEDNDEVRSVAVQALHELGYGVLEAADADQALQRLDANPEVKLLFTDVRMPGRLTGADLANEAVQRRPGLKVLYTSGYAGTDIEPASHEILQKPYRAQDLAARVRAVLAASAAEPARRARPTYAAAASA